MGDAGFVRVPEEWAPAPEGVLKMHHVAVLLDTRQIEMRQLLDGHIEWRRTPK